MNPYEYRTQLVEPPVDLPPGFGGILSTLTFGLIKDKPKTVSAPAMTQDQIMSQIAGVVYDTLAAQGLNVDVQKAKESAGHNLNLFGAWQQVLTDPNAVSRVVSKVIADLRNTPGLITTVTGAPLPTPAEQAAQVASNVAAGVGSVGGFSLNPVTLLGLGAVAILLTRKPRRGR